MRITWLLTVAILVGGCARGKPQFTGAVTVDQKVFEPQTCFAGPTAGFWGVDLVGKDSTLRLAYDPSGKAIAYLFQGEAKTGISLGECGTMTLVNIHLAHGHGTANLECSSNGHSVSAPNLYFRSCEFIK